MLVNYIYLPAAKFLTRSCVLTYKLWKYVIIYIKKKKKNSSLLMHEMCETRGDTNTSVGN